MLLCGFVFLTSTNIKGQSSEKSNKFFQIAGAKSSLSIPILIPYNNENDAKPFDTYFWGIDQVLYIKSREILPKVKLAIDVLGVFVLIHGSDASANDHIIGAMGLNEGASLIFMDALEIGATFSWGFGNTADDIYSYTTIIGVTPNVQYNIVLPNTETKLNLKAQFPRWINPFRENSTGLIISFGANIPLSL